MTTTANNTTNTTTTVSQFSGWTFEEISEELGFRQQAAENHRVAIGRDAVYDELLAEVEAAEKALDAMRR